MPFYRPGRSTAIKQTTFAVAFPRAPIGAAVLVAALDAAAFRLQKIKIDIAFAKVAAHRFFLRGRIRVGR